MRRKILFLGILLGMLSIPALRAGTLIKVDITDPFAVSFISTDAPSLVDDASAFPLGGVVLLDLFDTTSPIIYEADDVGLHGNLEVTGGGAPLEWAFNEEVGNRHLNLYASGQIARPAMEFSRWFRAFTGVSVADLSAASFAPVGTIGSIRTHDIFWGNHAVIGEFEVVSNEGPTVALEFRDGATVWGGGPVWSGTEDTGIRWDSPANNYGAATTLRLGSSTNDSMLIRFDLSSLSRGVELERITSATVTLTIDSASNTGINTLDLFLIDSADGGWLEGAQRGAPPPVGTGATYSHEVYDTTAWDGRLERPPVRRTALWPAIARKTFASAPAAGDKVEFHFYGYEEMALIRSWLEGGANGGFLILGYGEAPELVVRTSEHATVTDRPMLLLNVVLEAELPSQTEGIVITIR